MLTRSLTLRVTAEFKGPSTVRASIWRMPLIGFCGDVELLAFMECGDSSPLSIVAERLFAAQTP